ncbi:MAG: S-adenosylmethionine decarboxylase [bacterium]|nr:S-adenosylmethionine decarboxylase [bacterium]
MIKKSKIKNQKSKIYGKELTLDLYDCDPKIIRSKKKILEYSNKLCDLIKVKKYGKPIIERFALHLDYAAGYSLVQLIESSLVSGHFSELWNGAYINIFSCKDFDDKKAAAFTKKFFNAKIIKKRTLIR